MSGDRLKAELLLLWGAYEFLRENDLSSVSSTSRLLRVGDADYLRGRLAQEMLEMAGVVTGDHRHKGLPQDAILEGSQVCYWLYLLAIRDGLSFMQLQPDVYLSQSTHQGIDKGRIASEVREAAQAITGSPAKELGLVLREVLRLLGRCLALFEIDAADLVGYDLAQMRERPYMYPYFAGSGSG